MISDGSERLPRAERGRRAKASTNPPTRNPAAHRGSVRRGASLTGDPGKGNTVVEELAEQCCAFFGRQLMLHDRVAAC
jgi:hypothetical protein